MREKYRVPFDLRKSARDNVIEWVGEDDRMMRFISHCDLHEIPLMFTPGENWCYIDAMSPYGNPLTSGDSHTMAIDLCGDRFILLGGEDIQSGIDRLEEMYSAYREKAVASEVQSLLRL
jgi:hypothetical protein